MQNVNAADVAKGALAGLIGGLVASFVMSEFQTLLTKLGEYVSENKKQQTEGDPATVKAAEKVSKELLGRRLSSEEKEIAGPAMHYAMGGASGMIYGVASELAPITTVGAGMPFGTAVWLIADDVVVPALGLSNPVTDYPLSTNAYALSSHLVYGLTTDIVRRMVRRTL